MKWGLFSLDKQGLIKFFKSPAKGLLEFWNYHKEKEIEELNLSSIAQAKLSHLIESALVSFSGSKNANNSLTRFLPFKLNDKHSKYQIDQQTVDCFWDFFQKERPPHIIYAFSELHDILEERKND